MYASLLPVLCLEAGNWSPCTYRAVGWRVSYDNISVLTQLMELITPFPMYVLQLFLQLLRLLMLLLLQLLLPLLLLHTWCANIWVTIVC